MSAFTGHCVHPWYRVEDGLPKPGVLVEFVSGGEYCVGEKDSADPLSKLWKNHLSRDYDGYPDEERRVTHWRLIGPMPDGSPAKATP